MRPNGGLQSFYSIDSSTGQATLVGTIGAGTLQIEGLAVVDPSLTLSPAAGVYTSVQHWDFVIVADLMGRGVVSGTAFLDGGVEVTAALASCVIPGTAVPGVATFRCPGVVGALLGPGKHAIDVTLVLTDGAQIHRQVYWTILTATEP